MKTVSISIFTLMLIVRKKNHREPVWKSEELEKGENCEEMTTVNKFVPFRPTS